MATLKEKRAARKRARARLVELREQRRMIHLEMVALGAKSEYNGQRVMIYVNRELQYNLEQLFDYLKREGTFEAGELLSAHRAEVLGWGMAMAVTGIPDVEDMEEEVAE